MTGQLCEGEEGATNGTRAWSMEEEQASVDVEGEEFGAMDGAGVEARSLL